MRSVFAMLAAVTVLGGLAACGGSGDEAGSDRQPGDPAEAVGPNGGAPDEEDDAAEGRWVAAQAPAGAAGAASTTIVTSPDGAGWEDAGTIDGVNVSALAWGQDRWLAVGVDSERSSHVYSSTDLESWEEIADLDWTIEALAHGDGQWVAAGHASSGMTSGGRLMATPVVYTSTDGTEWTEHDIITQNAPDMQLLRAVAHDADGWVIAGIDATMTPSPDVPFSFGVAYYTSSDGEAWSRVDQPIPATTDGPRVALATDGTEWVQAAETYTFDPDGEGYGGVFVDAAITLDPLEASEPIEDTPFEATPADELAYGDGTWLAVANGPPLGQLTLDWQLEGPTTFYASTDARTWEEVGDSPELITALAYGGESGDDPAPPPSSSSSTAEPSPEPTDISTLPAGLFCRDLAAQGYRFEDALAYWELHGRPAQMDADGNGIPCETVYPDRPDPGGESPHNAPPGGEPPCTVAALQQVPVRLLPQNEPYSVTAVVCDGEWAAATTQEGRTTWSRLFRWSGSSWSEVVERPCEPGTLPADIHPIACPAG